MRFPAHPVENRAGSLYAIHSRVGGGALNIQPQVEELEDRSVPSVSDLVASQQQVLVPLEVQFNAFVSIVQSNLQTDLNHLEALAPSFPAPMQPLLNGLFAQEQQYVNAFPVLADARFIQTVINFEMLLLVGNSTPAAVVAPGLFYPFFPGYFGYSGTGSYGYGIGTRGAAYSTASPVGASSSSIGSVGSAAHAVTGRGMGVGIMSTVGALTLPQSNQS